MTFSRYVEAHYLFPYISQLYKDYSKNMKLHITFVWDKGDMELWCGDIIWSESVPINPFYFMILFRKYTF